MANTYGGQLLAGLNARLQRSLQSASRSTAETLRMDPLGGNRHLRPLPLFKLTEPGDLDGMALGCDSDLGGLSTARLLIMEDPQAVPPARASRWGSPAAAPGRAAPLAGAGVFSGALRHELPQGAQARRILERGGYAAFRTKVKRTLFGEQTWDAGQHDALRLRVKNSGDDMRYFVNFQIKHSEMTDLYQHRLWLGKVGEWEDILIPFSDFSLTSKGRLANAPPGLPTDGECLLKTVGISVLEKPGEFELGIAGMECVNAKVLEMEAEAEGGAAVN